MRGDPAPGLVATEADTAARTRRVAVRARRIRRAALVRRLTLYAAVAAGSVAGGTLRWLASVLLPDRLGVGFPWATLAVNVLGSFLIGLYAGVTGPDGRRLAGPVQRQFVMTGVCGGFTTFSMFSLETAELAAAGSAGIAAVYVAVSVPLWLAAVWLGAALATHVSRLR